MAEFAPTVARLDGRIFLVQGTDQTDGSSAAKRHDFLEQHLHYVEKNCDSYLACGPMWEPGTSAINSSFFLVQADDEDKARAIVEGDPYVDAGVYGEIKVSEISVAAGKFLGGVIWEDAESVKRFASQPRSAGE